MKKVIQLSAIALALAGMSGVAQAQKVSTNGGLRVQTDDGKFEFRLGARIHFDTYIFDGAKVNGQDDAGSVSTTEFRRTRLTLRGKAYGWDYILEQDFSAGNTTAGYRDVNISTKVGPGTVVIGQFKPFRGMEELTSSNEVTMMERPFVSASGLFSGRQFQQGVAYRLAGSNYTFNNAFFNLRDASAARNEGVGFSSRATFTPIASDSQVFHIGGWYSVENANRATPALNVAVSPFGRRGAGATLGAVDVANGESQDALGLELAFSTGPFYVQAEYSNATLGQDGAQDLKVDAYYIQAAFNLSGLSKPYNKGNGTFQSVKVSNAGVTELTLRYDYAEEKKSANRPEASALILGVNYYVNPNTRFMVNYTMGESEAGAQGNRTKREENQLAARVQFAF